MLGKYIIPVVKKDGTCYYAYRYLTNEAANSCTVTFIKGKSNSLEDIISCDLTGATCDLTGATMTAGCIDGTATDLKNITVKSDASDATTYNDAVITFADGTVLKVTIEVISSETATAKEELGTLIANMQELASKVATFVPKGEIALTTTADEPFFIYSNAEIAEGSISNLLDNDNSTYIHTAWGDKNSEDGLNHYLRVYLGEDPSLDKFKFSYVTRTNPNNEKPKQITVAGSETKNGVYTTIAVLTGLPEESTQTYTSADYERKNYKYLRFMVDDTYRDLVDKGNHKVYSMAEFNLYRVETKAEVFDEFKEAITNDFAAEQYNVLVDAIEIYDNSTSATEINAKKEALLAAYDALSEKYYSVRPEEYTMLTELIADMEAVIEKIAVVNANPDAVEGKIALQANAPNAGNYIWSNAPQANEPVGNLLDNDPATIFHSNWQSTTAPADGLDHHLTVELSKATSLFQFYYKSRNKDSNEGYGDYPKTIKVQGSNNGTDYTDIATIYPRNAANEVIKDGAEWTSPVLGDGNTEYSYLRFIVTETTTNKNKDGHIYWHMAEFELYNVKVGVIDAFTTFRGITNDKVVEAYTALLAAKEVNEDGSHEDKQKKYNVLKPIYDALIAKLQQIEEGVYMLALKSYMEDNIEKQRVTQTLPQPADMFIAYNTTPENGSHEGYKLIATGTHEAYAEADKYFTITHNNVGYSLAAQGMYLKQPDLTTWNHIMFSPNKEDEGVYLFTEENGCYKIANIGNGYKAMNAYAEYVIGNDAENKYSTFTIKKVTKYPVSVPESGYTTLSLGFNVILPSGVTAYDVEIDSKNPREYNLVEIAKGGDILAKNTPVIIKATEGNYSFKITMSDENAKGKIGNSVLTGTLVKTYVNGDGFNYKPVIEDGELVFNLVVAATRYETANSAWMRLAQTSGNVIVDEIPEITAVYPEAGNVYRIKSYVENTPAEYQYHYVANSNASITFPTTVTADDKSAMWLCLTDKKNNGKYTFVSALGTVAFGWKGGAETAQEYGIAPGVANGALTMKNGDISLALVTEAHNNNGHAAFNQATNATVQVENWSTDWYFELVEDASVSYEKQFASDSYWATMYLPYAVKANENIEVYYAVESAINDKVIGLTPIETGIIPKNTAVLLHRGAESGTNYEFPLSAEEGTAISGNLFKGNILQTAIDAKSDKVYILLNYNDKEAFYWMADDYNANCEISLGGGYVKCDANKAYFTLPKATQAASAYSFRFPGTTGIEEITGEGVNTGDIYDLQGRKVISTVKGGIYIMNGKKFIAR